MPLKGKKKKKKKRRKRKKDKKIKIARSTEVRFQHWCLADKRSLNKAVAAPLI
jgi:hypothetical protein